MKKANSYWFFLGRLSMNTDSFIMTVFESYFEGPLVGALSTDSRYTLLTYMRLWLEYLLTTSSSNRMDYSSSSWASC